MKNKQIAACVLLQLICVIANAAAAATDWPMLIDDNHHPECTTALRLAEAAHKSTAFNLWEPQTLPDDLDNTLVLGPQGLDLSGGDALDVNLEVFTKVPLPQHANRSLYWQIQTHQSNRIVIEELPRGWRGDTYAVRWVPTTLSTSEYFAATDRQVSVEITTLIEGAWRAPLVFQRKKDTKLWVIYVGEPYVFSPDWVVYLTIAGELQESCKIQFRPNASHATSLLPNSVQRLATLLDQSIGRDENTGTLQPIAQLRINVNQAWANAAMRPWAMGVPYNSRKEVDAGLTRWAQNGKAYEAAYAEVLAQYKIAEKALTTYYIRRFNMSEAKSASTAKRVLDTVLRTHYVFSHQH